jgi:hypothetical protein
MIAAPKNTRQAGRQSPSKASGRKQFFFEKTNQKLLPIWAELFPARPQPDHQKFLASFFSKKKPLLPYAA